MDFKAFGFAREGQPGSLPRGVVDGNGNPGDVTDGIFPIIQVSGDGPWNPIGTGFFISNNGLFATAKHVVTNSQGDVLPSLAGVPLLLREGTVLIRQVIQIVVHPVADVAVGLLIDPSFVGGCGPNVNKFFDLTEQVPESGAEAITFAFPKSMVMGGPGAFRLSFTTSCVMGTVQAYYPEGRDRTMLPGRCFQTTMDLQGGASGGPVASSDGSVFGINSTGMDGHPISWISSVADLLDLHIHNIRLPSGELRDEISLRELAALGLVAVDSDTSSAPLPVVPSWTTRSERLAQAQSSKDITKDIGPESSLTGADGK
jgi:hypothetical protein